MGCCGVAGCDREGVLVKGVCRMHYMRQLRKGTTDDRRKNARKECSAQGCGRLSAAHGLCDMHYRRTQFRPTLHPGRSCDRCSEPIPAERKSTAKFCSQRCKLLASQPRRARRYQLKTKYGMTDVEFDAMLSAQGGGCAICGTTEPTGRGQRFHVDHCHATDRVRGLLCNECNTGLGKFKDDPALLRRAVEYLTA